MKIIKIPFSKTGYYRIITSPDVERVDPVKYYGESFLQMHLTHERDLLLLYRFPFPIQSVNRLLVDRAIDNWDERFKEIMETKVPENFLTLFTSDSKKEQIKLLRHQNLTPIQLIALIFHAWLKFGYTFSQYTASHHHSGLNTDILPTVIEVQNDDTVIKVGSTTLSDGQLRNVVEHRKVIISKFLDRGPNWHCFFLTFNSIRRKESWQDGQPHFHYLSDKFGISREDVVTQLRSKNYNLGSLPHIGLIGYGDDNS